MRSTAVPADYQQDAEGLACVCVGGGGDAPCVWLMHTIGSTMSSKLCQVGRQVEGVSVEMSVEMSVEGQAGTPSADRSAGSSCSLAPACLPACVES
jgi:hypothetical protein